MVQPRCFSRTAHARSEPIQVNLEDAWFSVRNYRRVHVFGLEKAPTIFYRVVRLTNKEPQNAQNPYGNDNRCRAFNRCCTSAAAAASTAGHFTRSFLGASVKTGESVYDVRGPGGYRGAAVQIVKVNASGTAGTDTATSYDASGTIVSKDQFTLSKPDANGIVTITGTGHFVSGTGIYKHIKGKYKFTGTDNAKTGVIMVKVTGTETL